MTMVVVVIYRLPLQGSLRSKKSAIGSQLQPIRTMT